MKCVYITIHEYITYYPLLIKMSNVFLYNVHIIHWLNCLLNYIHYLVGYILLLIIHYGNKGILYFSLFL